MRPLIGITCSRVIGGAWGWIFWVILWTILSMSIVGPFNMVEVLHYSSRLLKTVIPSEQSLTGWMASLWEWRSRYQSKVLW